MEQRDWTLHKVKGSIAHLYILSCDSATDAVADVGGLRRLELQRNATEPNLVSVGITVRYLANAV